MSSFLLPSPHPTHKGIHSLSRPHREGASTPIWTHLSSKLCVSSFPISQPCSTSHSSSLSITSISSPSAPPSSAGTDVLRSLAPKIPSLGSLSTDLSLFLSSHLNIYMKIYDFLDLSPDTVLPRSAVDPRGLLSRRSSQQPCLLLPAPPGSNSYLSLSLLPRCFPRTPLV